MVFYKSIRSLLQKKVQDCYVPYSHFPVVSLIVTCAEEMIYGVNVENASFGLTSCAERNALFSYLSQGKSLSEITHMYLYTPQPQIITPCGGCRQVMLELLPASCQITCLSDTAELTTTTSELLPYAFTEADLSKEQR